MGRSLTYPRTKSTTVHRHDDRATYDIGDIHRIVNSTSVAHVSFSPDPEDPFPAILPMIAVMGSWEFPSASLDEPMDCYLHGYVSARIMRLAKASKDSQGLAVCVAATKVDGLILALTPFNHSYNYRSVVLHGYATLVEDHDEKVWAMQIITNKVVPDRWQNSRVPPDGAEVQSTSVLRVKVVSGSGKVRDGGVHDEAKDLKREDVAGEVWTGVIPLVEKYCEPIAAETNKVGKVPAYVGEFVVGANREAEEYAVKAANLP